MTTPNQKTILALDVGTKRIGVAIANTSLPIVVSRPTLANDQEVFDNIKTLISQEKIDQIVVGLPLDINGRQTNQTDFTRGFADRLRQETGLKVDYIDETLTSMSAEETLRSEGKAYSKSDIDSLSAKQILEDYLSENSQ